MSVALLIIILFVQQGETNNSHVIGSKANRLLYDEKCKLFRIGESSTNGKLLTLRSPAFDRGSLGLHSLQGKDDPGGVGLRF